ncbi:MAG TPA: hypothetical protein VH913_07465 [Hyphomicrobiaceae bacterium]
MTCSTKGNVRYRARTAIATIALVTGGYLVICGSTAAPAAAEGWLTKVWPGASRADPAEGQTDAPQYVGAPPEKKTADKAADPAARTPGKVAGKDDLFRPGPQYDEKYDPQGNVDIYGKKSAVEPPRPPIELGRQQYTSGQYDPSSTLFGQLNPLLPGLAVYGDWRTAVAYNGNNGKDIAQIATRLNIDVDLKLTGTERIHAFFTPLQKNAKFTRYEFGGGDGDGRFTGEFDFNPQTLFFEGDLGSIVSGISGKEAGFDLPFTVGLFPLFLQNGIWANDAILGGAVTIPAKNSAKLGLPNYDITFFAAGDDVDNAGILGAGVKHQANLFGATTFIDAFQGYIEAGYAVIQGVDQLEGQTTNFVSAAYSRRYGNILSNSTRLFANFGSGKNDEGLAIISENSLITSSPNLIPYANFFVGFGNPQPLVDGNGAGILKNVGINFETDALTGYPKLDDTASAAYGGALGLIYLFGADLGQQLVFEVATVQPFEEDNIGAQHAQYGFGVRYQIALTRAWLLRADATYQLVDGADDNFGVRLELRRKF